MKLNRKDALVKDMHEDYSVYVPQNNAWTKGKSIRMLAVLILASQRMSDEVLRPI